MAKENQNVLVNEEKDVETLQLLMKIKNNIMNYIDVSKTIEIITNVIDESENFKFRSEMSKKRVTENNPTFVFMLDDEGLKKDNINSFNSKEDYNDNIKNYEDKVADKLDKEVLSHIGRAIFESIKDDSELHSIMDKNDLTMKDLMITNIYVYRLSDPYTNTISLSLFI